MKPLDRKLVRDLSRLRGQVFTIAVVVACGIASYVTLLTAWSSLDSSKSTYYERYRFADIFASLKRAPETLVERIENIPGVARVYTRVVEEVMLPIEGMPEPASGRIVSLPSGRQPILNGLYLRQGRMPEPGRSDETLIIEAFANAHGLAPGDQIPAVINGTLRDLRIVGIALSPEYVFTVPPGDFAPDDKRSAVLWMDRQFVAAAFRMEGAFNDVVIGLQPGTQTIAVTTALDRLLEPYGGLGAVGQDKQLSNFMLEGEMTQLRNFATIVPIIFLGVAAFLVNIVLSRLVYLQRQQIAVIKAMGYSNGRVALHYLKFVSVIVVLGAILGAGVGAWLGQSLTELYTGYFRFPTLLYHFDLTVVITAIVVSLLAAVVGALAAVRQVVRMPPAEAMRPPSPAIYRKSYLERLGLARLIGQSGLMVVRELRRRPLRTLFSSLGIAAAIGIMIVGNAMYDSFDYMITEIFHRERRGDMTVSFLEPISASAARALDHVPGVLDAEGMRAVPVRFRAGPVWRDSTLNGLPDEPRLHFVVDRDGREVSLPAHGIALSRKLAEILDVGVGDTIEVEVREGSRETRTVTVNTLADDTLGLQGYIRMSELSSLLGEEPSINMAQLVVDSNQISVTHSRLKEMPTIARVVRKQVMIDRFREQMGQSMRAMTVIMVAFAASIAGGVVYNNARVALSVRTRDLASLRVLGFTRTEISAVLLSELAVQVVLAIPIGLALGQWWTAAIMTTAVDPEAYRLPVQLSQRSYAFAVGTAVVASVISALLVRRKLDQLDLIGVLKTKE